MSGGGWRDWWTLLHPPYTAWHLSYVVVGASIAPHPSVSRLVATVLGFFFAVGVGAHALDELQGRPLRTGISRRSLIATATLGIVCAVVLGGIGVAKVGVALVPFIVVGPVLVVAYNAELFGGVVHTDFGFAAAWGAFPVLCAYVAETTTLRLAPVFLALGAFALSYAQRSLSTPARRLRRKAVTVDGRMTFVDGTYERIEAETMRAPLESALRAMSWGMVLFATGLAVARLS